MDALDVGIIRCMEARPYGARPKHVDALKPSHIAEALGTTHVTVRERVARLEEAGVIAGYQVYPNLRHLGLASSACLYRAPDERHKAEGLKALEEAEAISEVHDFLGPEVCIDVAHADAASLAARSGAVADALGDPRPLLLYERSMPSVARTLTNVDWRILQALRGDAKKPLAFVADVVGLSLKTVRRHHDRMAEEGSFFAVPRLDLSRLAGVIPFFLNFHAAGPLPKESVHAALAAFVDRRIHTYHPVDTRLGHLGLMLFARSVADMDELRARALEVPGVERVTAWVYRGWRERTEWIDDAIATKVAATRV